MSESRGDSAAQLGYEGGLIERIGIPRPLFWGFVGVLSTLSSIWGPRRVMWLGEAWWVVFGFLVWIQTTTREEMRGSAAGWFWFAFTGGLPTLGSAAMSQRPVSPWA